MREAKSHVNAVEILEKLIVTLDEFTPQYDTMKISDIKSLLEHSVKCIKGEA